MTDLRIERPVEVTVVIPTHNRSSFLRVALATVMAQRDAAVHTIVVDDGSIDDTSSVACAVDEARVTVLRHETARGVSLARNTGLAHVTTEWVAFLDDDDVLGPDHVAQMLAAARGHPTATRVGLVYSGYIVTDRNRVPVSDVVATSDADVFTELLSSNAVGPPSAVLLRTDAVRALGGFDEKLSILADWDLWIRMSQEYDLVRCDAMQVGYMRHSNNMHFAGDRFVREMSRLQAKHGAAAAARGRSLLGRDFPLHIAASYRAGGRRARASAWYLRSFAGTRNPRHLALAAGLLLGERAIERSRLRGRSGPAPVVEWLEEVQRLQGQSGTESPDDLDRVERPPNRPRASLESAARGLRRSGRWALRPIAARRSRPFHLDEQDAPEWEERAETAVDLAAAVFAGDSNADGDMVVRVADLGCGNMRLRRILQARLPFRHSYSGYDLLPQSETIGRVDLSSELPPGEFDLMFCLGVLEYLHDVPAFLARLREHCRLGVISYAIADTPNPITPAERRAFGWTSDYTQADLQRELEHHGFAVRDFTLTNAARTGVWVIRPAGPV